MSDFKEVPESELKWRCRRGMLELDLFLSRFVGSEKGLAQLSNKEKVEFYQLLDFPDQELYEILIGKTYAIDREINDIAEKIQSCSTLSD
ncbi:MAG: succinate dehydrogenase assembly factor 2 [Gammaproteobacteria bacterium]|nr:succinate dehydrogenase assembly factor 2 [Gammaproteobacteria bacterium]